MLLSKTWGDKIKQWCFYQMWPNIPSNVNKSAVVGEVKLPNHRIAMKLGY